MMRACPDSHETLQSCGQQQERVQRDVYSLSGIGGWSPAVISTLATLHVPRPQNVTSARIQEAGHRWRGCPAHPATPTLLLLGVTLGLG